MALRQINEGLRNYLYGPLQPTNVGPSSTRSPRLPVGPDSAIPQGVRPIPTSSQQNKKTNVQIPYARMALAPIPEGEIVVIEHAPHYMKRKAGTAHHEAQPTVQVFTLEQANADLKAAAVHGAAGAPLSTFLRQHWLAGDGASAEAGLGRYRLDGVVNNSEHEAMLAPPYTGDYGTSLCQVNVAVQGHVRLLNDDARRCDMAKTHCGSVVYVGVWQRFTYRALTVDEEAVYGTTKTQMKRVAEAVRQDPRSTMHYYFERFSSTMLTAGKYSLGTPANGTEHAILHDDFRCCSLQDTLDDALFPPIDWASTNAYPGVPQSNEANYVPDLIRSFGTTRTAGPFGFERLVGAYVLGMTADSNQSPNMLTVVVNVDFRDWIGYEEVDRLRATYNVQDVVALVPPGGGAVWAVLVLPAHWQGWRPPTLLDTTEDALHTPPEVVPLANTAAARAAVDAELAAQCAKRSWRPTTVDDLIFKGHGPVARLLHSQWVAPNAAAVRDRQ